MIDKTGERWTPPFVLRCLENGSAGLFEVRGEETLGWMVVERYAQGGDPWLNVWIVIGKGLEHAGELIPQIDELAKSVGAKSWRCTGRKGWGRVGLKPIATVYERECT